MSGYVSYGPYSLGPNLSFQEKLELVEKMCKVYPKWQCDEYIKELEKEKAFLKKSAANAKAISDSISRSQVSSSNLEGNLDKARRQDEARRTAEDAYWESELEKEFAKLDRENPKSCKKDKDGKCTIMGGKAKRTGSKIKRKSNKRSRKVKRSKKGTKRSRY